MTFEHVSRIIKGIDWVTVIITNKLIQLHRGKTLFSFSVCNYT